MSQAVRLERDGDIAIIVIDNPPINAGSLTVRQGLLDAIRSVTDDPSLRAAVVIGAGTTFIAGSDIKEFGKPLQAPELPSVIAAIEASTKPFVAALSGAALGGGYELALGCDWRVAAPGTVVGLPEVTLGMIPGAGGTQRLPRLVGAAKAVELICSGARIEAPQAMSLGMVDEVAEGPLRASAIARARGLGATKHRVSTRAVPEDLAGALSAASDRAMKGGKARPPVAAAIAAIRSATSLPLVEALAEERAVFTRLRLGPDAAALRYLFFAERQAARGPSGFEGRRISTVGVIGAGTMGIGIAAAFLKAGLNVVLVDSSAAPLAKGMAALSAIVTNWAEKGTLDAGGAPAMLARLASDSNLEALSGCDCVVEAIIEDFSAKTSLFKEISRIVATDTLIASNTSYLDLDALASEVDGAGRFLGLHFFNPAHIMRLLEVVRSERTTPQTLADGLLLARRLGKHPVVAGVGPGFIGNRVYAAYRRQCEFMLEEGCLPEQIDAALEAFGFAMGPFATGDMSGLDIAWAMRKAQAAQRPPADRYCEIPDRLCEAGRLGRKTGKGYYQYPEPGRRGHPDPEVHQLIERVSSGKGVVRRAFSADEIVARALATMVNEAALLLAEGVARQASDVDVAFTNGFGFPRHEGGPLYWAARQDRNALHTSIDAIATTTGAGFRRGDIDAVLGDIIKE